MATRSSKKIFGNENEALRSNPGVGKESGKNVNLMSDPGVGKKKIERKEGSYCDKISKQAGRQITVNQTSRLVKTFND